jgi:hypothetical protein
LENVQALHSAVDGRPGTGPHEAEPPAPVELTPLVAVVAALEVAEPVDVASPASSPHAATEPTTASPAQAIQRRDRPFDWVIEISSSGGVRRARV